MQEQSACYLHDLGPLMALPSRRGASHVRLERKKSIFLLPVAPPTGAPGTRRGALACARCTFVLRMVLSPQRGAHFPYLRGHEHHLGSAKLSSRLRAVRILKDEPSPARGAHFYAHLRKPMFLERRPSPARPPRTCHRALACAACSFLNKTALSPRRRAHFVFKRLLNRPRAAMIPSIHRSSGSRCLSV